MDPKAIPSPSARVIINVMGQGQVSDQSGTSWYPVTASSYKVTVLDMSIITFANFVAKVMF